MCSGFKVLLIQSTSAYRDIIHHTVREIIRFHLLAYIFPLSVLQMKKKKKQQETLFLKIVLLDPETDNNNNARYKYSSKRKLIFHLFSSQVYI